MYYAILSANRYKDYVNVFIIANLAPCCNMMLNGCTLGYYMKLEGDLGSDEMLLAINDICFM